MLRADKSRYFPHIYSRLRQTESLQVELQVLDRQYHMHGGLWGNFQVSSQSQIGVINAGEIKVQSHQAEH